MKVVLRQRPEGSPNSCFGLYDTETERNCFEFVQFDWDYTWLASLLGWIACEECQRTDGTVDCEHRTVSEMLCFAFDFLESNDGETFNLSGYPRF